MGFISLFFLKLYPFSSPSITYGAKSCSEATIGCFCELVEDFCGRAEIFSEDREESEWISMPLSDLRMLANEITSLRAKRLLHKVPVDTFVRLLRILDHQIHGAEGLSINEQVSFL